MNSYILNLILFWSSFYNVDPTITMQVIEVESNYNVTAVGTQGEIGLMQLSPNSFPSLKPETLFNPSVNIRLGVKYLAECKKSCKHKKDMDFLICYNAGIVGGSKYKYPRLSKYLRQYYE